MPGIHVVAITSRCDRLEPVLIYQDKAKALDRTNHRGYSDVPLHRSRHLPCHPVLLLLFHPGVEARGKFGVKLPAISGHPDFERVFRAQMNTLEWMPIFLPSLWLFAIYIGDRIAAALGAGLDRRPHPLRDRLFEGDGKRGPGFAIQIPGRPSRSGSVRSARSSGGSFRRQSLSRRPRVRRDSVDRF